MDSCFHFKMNMNQQSIFECAGQAQRTAASGYVLHMPDGEDRAFTTLANLLSGMNECAENVSRAASLPDIERMSVSASNGRQYAVVKHYNHIGIVLSANEATAQGILEQLFDDVYLYARDNFGCIRQPWQMPRAHWAAIDCISKVAYGIIPCLSKEHVNQTCYHHDGRPCSVTAFMLAEFFRRYGYGNNGPTYDGSQVNSRHEVHVAYALARGDAVPELVLQDYAAHDSRPSYDLRFFSVLLEKPYLRGRITADRLNALLSFLRSRESTVADITEENSGYLVGLMDCLPPEASYVEIDDLLYANGILDVRQLPTPAAPPDNGIARNEFAAKLRLMQIEARTKRARKMLEEEATKQRLPIRERLHREAQIADIPNWESHNWANKIADAITARNLDLLVEVLDGTNNETTKRAIEIFHPVKLTGVRAADRRKAVFALAGFTTEDEYRKAEIAFEVAARERQTAQLEKDIARKRATRLDDARDVAARTQFRLDGVVMDGVKFIDAIMDKGYTRLETVKRGAAIQYRLANPESGAFYKLVKSQGTVEYVRAMLERQEVEAALA